MTKRKPWWRVMWGNFKHWYLTVTHPEPWDYDE